MDGSSDKAAGDRPARIVVTCAKGLGPWLQRELRALGAFVEAVEAAHVVSRGTLFDAQRFNLWLRTAHRVLYAVGDFPAATPDDLYAGIRAIAWEEWLLESEPFTVSGAVQNPTIRDPRFAWMKTKDAIADRLRETLGARPDSTSEAAGAAGVFVRWKDDRAAVYVDTSGEPLARRGYRLTRTAAPMQETLAAGVVLATGWRDASPLLNPMCGSGTIAIEAAWIGLNRAPGLLRSDYAFMHLRGYDPESWRRLCEAARREERPALEHRIVASDVDPAAVDAARANARAAGVESAIDFEVADFESSTVPPEAGVVVLNPEYGARMGEPDRLAPLYRRIGQYLSNACPGWRAYVLTGNAWLSRQIGTRPDRTHLFYNGPIECRLLEYGVRQGPRPSTAASAEGDAPAGDGPPLEGDPPPGDASAGADAAPPDGPPPRERPSRPHVGGRERGPRDDRRAGHGRGGTGGPRGRDAQPTGDRFRERRPYHQDRGPGGYNSGYNRDRPQGGGQGGYRGGGQGGYRQSPQGGYGGGGHGDRSRGRYGDRPHGRFGDRPQGRGGRYGDREQGGYRPQGGYRDGNRDRQPEDQPPLPDDFGNRVDRPDEGTARRRFDRGAGGSGNRFGDRRPYPGRPGNYGGPRDVRPDGQRYGGGPGGQRYGRPEGAAGGRQGPHSGQGHSGPGHRPWDRNRRVDDFRRGGPGGDRGGPQDRRSGGPEGRGNRPGGNRPDGPRRGPPRGDGWNRGGPRR